ncbi:unnamed protein product [Effrenium voratum]|uniref:Uncharacterized protein n=1 Tax=Effrenium voratum TaxID=2562239 RepID=A0AA36IIV4_9DINO|nr:unnamed protein product [Effrenium voratum]
MEASRATAAEEGLQRTAEGLAAQLAQQGGEQLAMAERSKELAALMEQGHAEAKASQEAEKTALDTRLQEEQKAAEASREALQEMVSEMSRNAEAQLQQEKDRALEAEQGLREGLRRAGAAGAGPGVLRQAKDALAPSDSEAQAAATEESVRLSRGSEELRKQPGTEGPIGGLHEQSEKVEANPE